MSIPVLALDSPVTKPAVAETVYDSMWIYSVSVLAPDPFMQSGRIVIEYYPMVSGTGELKTDAIQRISTDKLWTLVGTTPEVATALGAILAAIKPIEAAVAKMQSEVVPDEVVGPNVVPEPEPDAPEA